jgi:DNA-directed RNA polymerase subunit E'
MFYKTKVIDHVRIPPSSFGLDLDDGIIKEVKRKFSGYLSKDVGVVIDALEVNEIGEGVIIPGDGATYYQATFTLLTFRPEMQEVIWGRVRDIADFGAFINLGPMEGMVHISQTMNDFVSFAKDKVLSGKDTKHILKVGDLVRARIIAISFKDVTAPKLGLTMRQQGLGREDWAVEDEAAAAVAADKEARKKDKKEKEK